MSTRQDVQRWLDLQNNPAVHPDVRFAFTQLRTYCRKGDFTGLPTTSTTTTTSSTTSSTTSTTTTAP